MEIHKLIVPQIDEKNPSNIIGKTPLHYAAMEGHFGVIDYMMDFVQDMHPLDNQGATPQDWMKQFYMKLRKRMNPRVASNSKQKKRKLHQ